RRSRPHLSCFCAENQRHADVPLVVGNRSRTAERIVSELLPLQDAANATQRPSISTLPIVMILPVAGSRLPVIRVPGNHAMRVKEVVAMAIRTKARRDLVA